MPSFFYHSFALLKHSFSCHSHINTIIHAYLFIKHHCTCVENITLEQEEGEPESEIVGDDTSIENKGMHICIFYPLFWINEVSMYVLFAHELLYVSMIS